MASIRDVALKAGVGIGTVSRALNGTGYISEETKRKIMEAVAELDYRPNELAQNLYRNRSGVVGFMVPDLEHPFFSSLTKAIEMELYKHGYKCMICDVDRKQSREEEFLEMLQRNVMDGLIAGVDLMTDMDVSTIHRPIVTFDRNWGPMVPNIHSDHKRGGELVAQALLNAGCKRVLQFTPEISSDMSFMERYHTLEQILREHGVEVINIYTGKNQMGYDDDIRIAEVNANYLREVDGIFASDITAATCLRLAHQSGIRVPNQLHIISCDGLPFGRVLYPVLTSIRQNVPEIARACVNAVVKQMDGTRRVPMEQIIDVSFQKGGTV
ncbi:MAG: LacI family DNA-binding transcriptional regulator [Fusicatenibacter sp.]